MFAIPLSLQDDRTIDAKVYISYQNFKEKNICNVKIISAHQNNLTYLVWSLVWAHHRILDLFRLDRLWGFL